MEKGELAFDMVTIILPRLSVKNKFRDTGFIHLPFTNFGKLKGFQNCSPIFLKEFFKLEKADE